MKRIIPMLCVIVTLPFILCSCFDSEIESITLSKSSVEMIVGDALTLDVSATPDSAEIKKLTWTTSDNNVVTVDNGKIKGKSAGTAVVTVTCDKGLKADCSVVVKDKEIEKVKLSESSTSVKKGSKIQLIAKIQPADAQGDGLVWSSNDESVATVNQEGFVTGKAVGTADIICRAPNGKEAVCSVIVKSGKPITPTGPTAATIQHSVAPTDDKNESTTGGESSASNSGNGEIFPESSSRKLSDSEVSGISSEKAQAAINEIFARNGYIFKDKELRSYYESKPWYSPDPNFSQSKFNAAESYNVALLSKYR